MGINIRAYKTEDFEGVMDLFRINSPKYFHPDEEQDLDRYLTKEVEDYFVVEDHGRLVGACGINYFPAEDRACLSWGFIHPEFHGKGIGRQMTQYRIEHVRALNEISVLTLRTTQLVYEFYEKNGFELERIEENYWGEGYHLYEMKIILNK